ncbi:hypothetical protein NLI96_g8034 [Meripilus lineatus]|uniref:CCHC-type domain-containing protein n=1 Tax=Meripilus lineatus TaxID=2056292 RepID=A0AAD5YGL0_9APHY|nr:hypothetical protein NLI96_g8034 [Physisporinus lineatus]
MLGKMADRVFLSTKNTTTPFETLTLLNTRFNVKTAEIKAVAREKMYTIKCHHDANILKHIDSLEVQSSRLADLGCVLDDEDYIAIITTSVTPAFRELIRQERKDVQTHNELGKKLFGDKWTEIDLTAAKVIEILRAEGISRAVTSPKSKDSANSASGGGENGKGNRGKGRSRSNSASSSSSIDLASITCYRCNGIGHKANRCASPKDILKKKSSDSLAKRDSSTATSATDSKGNRTDTAAASAHVTFNVPDSAVSVDSSEIWAATASGNFIHPQFPNSLSVIDCASLDDLAMESGDLVPAPFVEGEPSVLVGGSQRSKGIGARLIRAITKNLPRIKLGAKRFASMSRTGKVRGGVLKSEGGEMAPGVGDGRTIESG